MKTFAFAAFIVMALVQWYVPLSMVRESEFTLTEGDEVFFRTRPVDPSDPFRGKYVNLDFEEENQELDSVPRFFAGQEVYASFTLDSAGFADLLGLYEDHPGKEHLWVLKVKVIDSYMYGSTVFQMLDNPDKRAQMIRLEFPFKRFYLEESMASDAERAYWESTTIVNPDSLETRSYAVVRIKGTRAVLTDVRINDKSIIEIVKEMNAEKIKN